jgi:hypothetical protein
MIAADEVDVMVKIARIVCLAAFGVTVAGTAIAQDYTRVRPRWNQFGSAVCPERYDYYRGWCRLRGNEPPREYGYGRPRGFGYGGAVGVPPQWNSRGSAVCPDDYDYYAEIGLCMPRTSDRVPPRWNSRGSAVCPENYDYYGGWCIAREESQGRGERDEAPPAQYGDGRGVPPQWNSRGSAVCPGNYDYFADIGLCMPRG